MKAIILLICRSRFHVPRVGGFIHSAQFAPFTHPYQPFVFEGRTLDMDEFNVAASRLLDVRNANLGYEVSVRMVPDELPVDELAPVVDVPVESTSADETAADDSDEPAVDEGPAPGSPDSPEWVAPQPGTEYVAAVDPSTEEPASEAPASEAPAFRMDGKHIFRGEARVGGLFGEQKQLRIAAEYSDLRPEIEAWLQTINPTDQ